MEESDQHSKGLASAAQRLGETLLSILRNRLELLGLELQEEKERAVFVFFCAAASIFFTFAALIIVTITVVALVPESSRPLVLIGFSVLYILLALFATLALRKRLKGPPPPFANSVAELKKDIASLRTRE